MEDYSYIYWIHILLVGPFFIYLGVEKNKIPDYVYTILILLGLIVILYHSYKLYKYKNKIK